MLLLWLQLPITNQIMSSTVKVVVRFPSRRHRGKWRWQVETERYWHHATTCLAMRLNQQPYKLYLAATHTACLYAATRDANKSGVPAVMDCMLEGWIDVARTPQNSYYQLRQEHRPTDAGMRRLASGPRGMRPMISRSNETCKICKDSHVNLHSIWSCMSTQCLITDDEMLSVENPILVKETNSVCAT